MKNKYTLFFTAIFILGVALRLIDLAQRPMHTDEAVHALKFKTLLEDNRYTYDPVEYHGPTLNYFTLIPAWITGASDLTQVTEIHLRVVPVFFGLLLILGLLFLKNIGWVPVLAIACLTAISPALVFYNRYYIQETLLVCFTFGVIVSGYRYLTSGKRIWAVLTGVFLGLMHATKETFIIALGAMGLAGLLLLFLQKSKISQLEIRKSDVALALFSGLAVSALFFSSFVSNPQGLIDSVLAYKTYLNRAGHNEVHIHPWFYYFKLLFFTHYTSRPIWTEGIVLLLAAVGIYTAWCGPHDQRNIIFIRFVALYSLILAGVYSVIPYKTPWSMLGFYHGFILLAGYGLVNLFRIKSNPVRTALISISFIGIVYLVILSVFTNFRYDADPANPYVYGHSSDDVIEISNKVKQIAKVHPEQYDMMVEVICPGYDYWPLPWYLRQFTNVGWWSAVNMAIPPAPVILAFPSVEQELLKKLYEIPPPGEKNLYMPLFKSYTQLRPGVEIRGYIVKDLWDRFLRKPDK